MNDETDPTGMTHDQMIADALTGNPEPLREHVARELAEPMPAEVDIDTSTALDKPADCSTCDGTGTVVSPDWRSWYDRQDDARKAWGANHRAGRSWYDTDEARDLDAQRPAGPNELDCAACDGTGVLAASPSDHLELSASQEVELQRQHMLAGRQDAMIRMSEAVRAAVDDGLDAEVGLGPDSALGAAPTIDDATDTGSQPDGRGQEIESPEPDQCSTCGGDGWLYNPDWREWHTRDRAARDAWDAAHPNAARFDWYTSAEAQALQADQPDEHEEYECEDCGSAGQHPVIVEGHRGQDRAADGRDPAVLNDPRLTPDQTLRAASDAIGLFLEYRDQHGYDEDVARLHALGEVSEGIAAGTGEGRLEAERQLAPEPRATIAQQQAYHDGYAAGEDAGRANVRSAIEAVCEQWQRQADDTANHTPSAYMPDQYRRKMLLRCSSDLRALADGDTSALERIRRDDRERIARRIEAAADSVFADEYAALEWAARIARDDGSSGQGADTGTDVDAGAPRRGGPSVDASPDDVGERDVDADVSDDRPDRGRSPTTAEDRSDNPGGDRGGDLADDVSMHGDAVEQARRAVFELKGRRALEHQTAPRTEHDDQSDRQRGHEAAAVDDGPVLSALAD